MKLKSCPFCGSEKVAVSDPEIHCVVCEECGCFGPNSHGQWAAEVTWNARAIQPFLITPAPVVNEVKCADRKVRK